ELRFLVLIHGAEEVRAAIKRLTAKKRGRKPERDWPLLLPYIVLDATEWLDGFDPLKGRSNYSIAKEISEAQRGHHVTSTHRRLMKKLSEDRWVMMLDVAEKLAEKD